MYIGHYKSVTSAKEFYSKPRNTLDFPTQVEMEGLRYLLQSTYAIPSESIHQRVVERADSLGIPKDVEVK